MLLSQKNDNREIFIKKIKRYIRRYKIQAKRQARRYIRKNTFQNFVTMRALFSGV